MTRLSRIARRLGTGLVRFARNTDGVASVELVVYIPIIFSLLFVAIDLAMLFFGYARMQDVTRETIRQVAIGELPRNATTITNAIHARLSDDYAVTVDGLYSTVIRINVSASPEQMSAFGFFSEAIGDIAVRVQHTQEPLDRG